MASNKSRWVCFEAYDKSFGVSVCVNEGTLFCSDSFSFYSFEKKWNKTAKFKRLSLGFGIEAGFPTGCISATGYGYGLLIQNEEKQTSVTFHIDNFLKEKSLDGHFVFEIETYKAADLYQARSITGKVTLGNDIFTLTAEGSHGSLRWGRGEPSNENSIFNDDIRSRK